MEVIMAIGNNDSSGVKIVADSIPSIRVKTPAATTAPVSTPTAPAAPVAPPRLPELEDSEKYVAAVATMNRLSHELAHLDRLIDDVRERVASNRKDRQGAVAK